MSNILYCCSKCDKSFTKPCRLKEHELCHTGERPFKCTFANCTKSYRRKTHLAVHLLTHETTPEKQKPFQCTYPNCNAMFATNCHRKRHELVHTNPNPFKCTFENCNKSFPKHNQLRRHLCSHNNEIPYPCPEKGCQRGFQNPSKLRKHLETHREVYRYLCAFSDCEEEFTKWSELQAHKKTHDVKCRICGNHYKRDYMNQHLKTHCENRPTFSCPVENCDKVLMSAKTLNKHIEITHGKEKRFTCSVCGIDFGWKCSLTRHLETHLEKPEKKEKESRPIPTISESLSGFDYVKEREIPCPSPGCLHRSKRQYDMLRHIESKHREQYNELLACFPPSNIQHSPKKIKCN